MGKLRARVKVTCHGHSMYLIRILLLQVEKKERFFFFLVGGGVAHQIENCLFKHKF